MLGHLWYVSCLLGAFMWVVGSPSMARVLNTPELICAALVIGTLGPAYVTYLVGCCLSLLEPQTIILASLFMAYLVFERYNDFWIEWKRRLINISKEKSICIWSAAVAVITGIPMWFLYTTRMIPEENGKIFSGGSCWADLPIHMHIAESFLSGRNQDVSWGDMHSPVFAGEKMAYPFIPDWHAAVMVKLGATMREGFLYPGFVMSVAFFTLLFLFTVRVTRSRIAGIFAIILTVGMGGQGGVNFFLQEGLESALNKDVIQNDVSGDNKIFWFGFIPHVFLPQRGANFAYPLDLFILVLVWKATDMNDKLEHGFRRSLLMHAAGLACLLPLTQAHSFIGLAVIIGFIFVLDAHKWLRDWRLLAGWIAAGVVAAVLGGPQMLLFRNQAMHGHGGNFISRGWIHLNHANGHAEGLWAALPVVGGFFRFWWMNLGFAVPLSIAAIIVYGYDAFRAFLHARPLVAGRTFRFISGQLSDAHASASYGADSSIDRARIAAAEPASTSTLRRSKPDDTDSDSDRAAQRPRSNSRDLKIHAASEGLAGDLSLVEHLAYIALKQLPPNVQDVITGRAYAEVPPMDADVEPSNTFSINGRALDTVKLAVAAFIVFLIGNYINFQPWDRDNCKLYYVWVFVYAATAGSLLAAPIECLLSLPVGTARVAQLTFASQGEVIAACNPTAKAKAEDGDGAKAVESTKSARRMLSRTVSFGATLAVPVILFFTCLSGFLLVAREYSLYHQLLDEDQLATGTFIRENLPPKGVILHRDIHIMPPGCLAGRPTLLAYTGWMWSHGYNYYERDRDRNYIMANALKDSDADAYNLLRRWGVRYIVGEWIPRHSRPRQQEWEEARAKQAANPDEPISVPHFDPDYYLDGQLKRIFSAGRFDVFEVLGYPHPPT